MIPYEVPGMNVRALFAPDEFHGRHIGPSPDEEAQMLERLGVASRDALIRQTVPAAILLDEPLALEPPVPEAAALAELRALAARNQVWRSYLGAGYHDITYTAQQTNITGGAVGPSASEDQNENSILVGGEIDGPSLTLRVAYEQFISLDDEARNRGITFGVGWRF